MWVLVASEASSPALGQEEISHLADGIAGDAGKGETDRLASAGESGDIVNHAMMKRLGGRAVEGERLGGGSDHVVPPGSVGPKESTSCAKTRAMLTWLIVLDLCNTWSSLRYAV